jgi:methylated-DNA-protein-cysteine methyltransferase-like protein
VTEPSPSTQRASGPARGRTTLARNGDGATTLDEAVLAAVRSIPPGRVLTYGDVAEYVGTRAARNVGRILAGSGEHDENLPWHRVVRADGSCAEHIRAEQMQRLRGEGVPFVGGRVDLSRARWDGAVPAGG